MGALTPQQPPALSPLTTGFLAGALMGRLIRATSELDAARTFIAGEYLADQAILVDSGRSALALAIDAALRGAGATRIVALPAFQCYEVATAAVGVECRIALYDVDPATLRPDLASLERALELGASTVVIAPLYGLPVDWNEIVALTARYGAVAIEDAAQANGASWKGRRLGTLAELSVVSFGRGKGWTGGGGGALLLRGPQTEARANALPHLREPGATAELRTVTLSALQLAFGRERFYGIPASIPSLGLGETRYHEPTTPVHCTPFSAALLRRTAGAAEIEARARRANAEEWNSILPSGMRHAIPPVLSGGEAGYLRFPIRLSASNAERSGSGAAKQAGVARSYPLALDALAPVRTRLTPGQAATPGATALARELVTLPTHSRTTQANREVIRSLAETWLR